MQRRSWRWLRVRVEELLNRPPHLIVDGFSGLVAEMPTTRIGIALNPPKAVKEA